MLSKSSAQDLTLTGKQNSSKAGLTKVVYCDRICSRSRPRAMSRSTNEPKRSAQKQSGVGGGVGGEIQTVSRTSARQPHVGIGVHKQFHVEHVSHFLRVKDQDALQEDNVGRVNGDPLVQPESKKLTLLAFSV